MQLAVRVLAFAACIVVMIDAASIAIEDRQPTLNIDGESQLQARVRGDESVLAKAARVLGLPDEFTKEDVVRLAGVNHEVILQSDQLTRQEKFHVINYLPQLKRQRMYGRIKKAFSQPEWEAYRQEQRQYKKSKDYEGKLHSTLRAFDRAQSILEARKEAEKTERVRQAKADLEAFLAHKEPTAGARPGPSAGPSAPANAATPSNMDLTASATQTEPQMAQEVAPARPAQRLRLFGVNIDV